MTAFVCGLVLLALGYVLYGRLTESAVKPDFGRLTPAVARADGVDYVAMSTWRVYLVQLLNIAGLGYAIVTGEWRLKEMYEYGYFPIAGTMWALGALGQLPRVKPSTAGEGHERRYFYGSVWAVSIDQPVLWLLWKVLPHTRTADVIKLVAFVGILAAVGWCARLGLLPRTRPIVPGELAISD